MPSDRVSPARPPFMVPPAPPLSAAEGELLIQLVFSALRVGFGLESREDFHPPDGLLSLPAGAFVSIYHDDSLRGCLGALLPQEPLWQSIQEIALQAATCDPRFEPLEEEELSALAVEISVLGPLKPVTERSREFVASAIRVGEHGLSLRHRGRSGLLLPQVAEKQGWDALRFLEETCRKAGLDAGAWSEEGAELHGTRSFPACGGQASIPGRSWASTSSMTPGSSPTSPMPPDSVRGMRSWRWGRVRAR